MDQEALWRILAVACVTAIYVLCAWNLVRLMLSKGDPLLFRSSLLSAAFFMLSFAGFVALEDATSARFAGGYTVAALVAAIASHFIFAERWRAQAETRHWQIQELKGKVEALRAETNKSRIASLEEVCARAARAHDLTRREEEVLGLLLQEMTYAQIEEQLLLSHSTVKSHVRNLYRKMEVNRRESLPQKIVELEP